MSLLHTMGRAVRAATRFGSPWWVVVPPDVTPTREDASHARETRCPDPDCGAPYGPRGANHIVGCRTVADATRQEHTR